jgi:hypothetical protein
LFYWSASSGGKDTDDGEKWLGPEMPTPTIHATKVGSGTVTMSSIVIGLGSTTEAAVLVPFEIFRNKQGIYQIAGT